MYCGDCGVKLEEGARFCPNCGRSVAAQSAADAAAFVKGAQAYAAAAAAAIPAAPLSETPTLTQDFAVTRERFNLILAGTLLWGFVLNILFCIFLTPYVEGIEYGVILIVYLVMAVPGVIINTKSSKPIWSFVGYNMVVLPLGLMLSALLSEVGADAVRETFQITAAITAGMLLLSSWKPEVFSKIGPCLLLALGLAIVAELVLILLHQRIDFLNIIIALIFCGYIGVDWARAQQRPCTADNAIDSACALYLDIINLALRILASRSRDKD